MFALYSLAGYTSEAVSYTHLCNPGGCVETNLAGKLRAYSALADINLGSVMEVVLLNGKCRKTGKLCLLYTSIRPLAWGVLSNICFMPKSFSAWPKFDR